MKKTYAAAYLVAAVLLLNFAAQSQTRAQLQANNAYGYNYINGAYRGIFYIPLDTLATADSGAIAYKVGSLHLKTGSKWLSWGKAVKLNDSTFLISGDTISLAGNLALYDLTNTRIAFGDADNRMTDDADLTYIAPTNRLNAGTGNFADSLLVGRLRDGTTSDSIVVWDNITKALKKVVGSSLVTVSNGLTKTGNNITLGGLLTGSTFIECEQNVFAVTNTSQMFLEAKLASDPNKFSLITLEPSGSLIIRQNLSSNKRADILLTNQTITLAIDYDLATFINVFKLDTTFTYHNTKLGIIDNGVSSLTDSQIQSTLHVFGDATINLTPTGTSSDSVLVKGSDNKIYAVAQSSIGGGGGSPGGSGFGIDSLVIGGTQGAIPYVGTNSLLQESPTQLFFDSTNARVGIGTNSPNAKLAITTNSLGGNNLDLALNSSGIILRNTTPAAAGAQQVSPTLILEGQGWKSNATAASQPVQARLLVIPFQAAANPTGALRFQFSINGGTVIEPMILTSGGALSTTSTITSGSSFISASTGSYSFGSRSVITSPSDGTLKLSNAAQTDFGMLQFGGPTSSFFSIKRSGTSAHFRLADDSDWSPVSTGQITINGVQEFADNAAAITGGLTTGQVYRTGDILKIVH